MSEPSQDLQLATDIARDARSFLETLELVASGGAGSQAVALLLLDVAQMCVAGAHLGARTDVILDSNVEPVLEASPDLDLVRQGLATQLDPVLGAEVGDATISGDLVAIAGALAQGLRHYEAGQVLEALWWWQFSYLSSWGSRAASALRVVLSLLSHLRLDADEDVVADAEFDALHP